MAISFGGLGLPPLYTELKVKIDSFRTEMDKAGHLAIAKANEISKNMSGLSSVSKGLTKIGDAATKYVTLPLMAAGVATGKFAMDYETAFAGVRKTTEATEEEYAALSKGIREMSKEVPASAKAIAGVAEAAGQLGIEKDNLLSFSRVMIDLGESTNLSATEGATQLARFANITRMSQGDFDRLGSVIVDLGNNFATTEAEIVTMGLRLAGAGAQIGLTEAQIMGFATALSSVGIEAEAGGSAFSRVMVDMQLAVETNSERLEEFAGVAGMSAAEFRRAFEEDAATAMIAFIEGLGTAEDRGLSAIKVLDDMGITEIRLRDALLRASGASDVFTDAINLGNKAWEENNALTKEAEQRYNTTESQLQIQKNRLIDVGISIGEKLLPHAVKLAEKVADIVEWFGNLDEGTQSLIGKLALGAVAFGPVTKAAGGLLGVVTKIPSAFNLLKGGAQLALGGLKTFGAGAGTLTGILGKVTAAAGVGGASGAIGGVGATLATAAGAALPFVAAGAAVVAAGYGIYKGLTTEVIPSVDLFEDRTVTVAKTVTDAWGNISVQYETVTQTISEETKTQVKAFLELKEQVEQTTTEMYVGMVEVSEENIGQVTGNIQSMSDMAIQSIRAQKEENIADFHEIYGSAVDLSYSEQIDVITNIQEMATNRENRIKEMRDELVSLYEEIAEKGIENATEERERIAELMEELADESVSAMARSKDEQEILLSGLKRNQERLTAEMVGNVVKKLNEQRDKGVAAAQEQYSKQIDFALDYKENLIREYGTLTAEQEAMIQKMIDSAETQKEETIAAYEQLRINGLAKLRDEHGDMARQINAETGEILKWHEQMFGKAKEWNAFQYEDKEFTIRENHVIKTQRVNEVIDIRTRGTSISSYYSGLDHVPWDGYIARLHKGERVLTAKEAKEYSQGGAGNISVNIENFANHSKEDVQKLMRRIGQELQRQKVAKGKA